MLNVLQGQGNRDFGSRSWGLITGELLCLTWRYFDATASLVCDWAFVVRRNNIICIIFALFSSCFSSSWVCYQVGESSTWNSLSIVLFIETNVCSSNLTQREKLAHNMIKGNSTNESYGGNTSTKCRKNKNSLIVSRQNVLPRGMKTRKCQVLFETIFYNAGLSRSIGSFKNKRNKSVGKCLLNV